MSLVSIRTHISRTVRRCLLGHTATIVSPSHHLTRLPSHLSPLAVPSSSGGRSAGPEATVCCASRGGIAGAASRPFIREQDNDLLPASPFRIVPNTRAPAPALPAGLCPLTPRGRILRQPDPHVTALALIKASLFQRQDPIDPAAAASESSIGLG